MWNCVNYISAALMLKKLARRKKILKKAKRKFRVAVIGISFYSIFKNYLEDKIKLKYEISQNYYLKDLESIFQVTYF